MIKIFYEYHNLESLQQDKNWEVVYDIPSKIPLIKFAYSFQVKSKPKEKLQLFIYTWHC